MPGILRGDDHRRLEQRISEHASSESSALYQHQAAAGHIVDFQNPEVLACDNIRTRLFVKETLKIQELRAFRSLNRNAGSFELKLW